MSRPTPAARSLTASRYRILSYDFQIRCAGEIASRLDQLLSPFRHTGAQGSPDVYVVNDRPRSDPRFEVRLGDRCIQQAESLSGIVDYLVWKVNEEAVAHTDRFLALHAAAASTEGIGILLPGASGSGKTTLVAGLVREGFDYLTDEAALIDPQTGMLHPFPRALWMGPGGIDSIPGLRATLPPLSPKPGRNKHLIRSDELRPAPIGEPCPVRFIVFPHFEPGRAAELTPMPRAKALYLLADQCFNLAVFGSHALNGLQSVVAGSECFDLVMSDLGSAIDAVRTLYARRTRRPVAVGISAWTSA